jgi:hypothetical protein
MRSGDLVRGASEPPNTEMERMKSSGYPRQLIPAIQRPAFGCDSREPPPEDCATATDPFIPGRASPAGGGRRKVRERRRSLIYKITKVPPD